MLPITVKHTDILKQELVNMQVYCILHTGKRTNSANTSAVKDHMLVCNHQVTFEDFPVLATANNNFKLEIKESLLISRDKPILNRNISSLPLYLFYWLIPPGY